MTYSLYDVTVPIYRQLLRALLGVLDKGEKHCAEKGIDPATMLNAKLADDMLPFTFQIMQSITHSAGAIANARGQQRARASGLE